MAVYPAAFFQGRAREGTLRRPRIRSPLDAQKLVHEESGGIRFANMKHFGHNNNGMQFFLSIQTLSGNGLQKWRSRHQVLQHPQPLVASPTWQDRSKGVTFIYSSLSFLSVDSAEVSHPTISEALLVLRCSQRQACCRPRRHSDVPNRGTTPVVRGFSRRLFRMHGRLFTPPIHAGRETAMAECVRANLPSVPVLPRVSCRISRDPIAPSRSPVVSRRVRSDGWEARRRSLDLSGSRTDPRRGLFRIDGVNNELPLVLVDSRSTDEQVRNAPQKHPFEIDTVRFRRLA